MKTSINFPTRQAARNTFNNFKSAGKIVNLIDCGTSSPIGQRWSVSVDVTTTKVTKKATKRTTKKSTSNVNVGFDIRKVSTGVVGFDLYYNGEYLLRRGSKIEAYEAGVVMANKVGVDYTTLNYKN